MSRSFVVMAPAKINLTLEVLGKRPDGYHELASIFATVGLCDRVRVAGARSLDVRTAPPLDVPAGGDLGSRAVAALARASGREPAAHVRVRKRIPVAAGLGGGSSDAAAVLRGLARLWRLDGVDLVEVGARVGSDVPFFCAGAAFARATGRGETVEPLPAPSSEMWIALVTMQARVATRDVFARQGASRSSGERTTALAKLLRDRAATVARLRDLVVNDLTEAATAVAPAIAEARALAAEAGVALSMSGSGPSLFALGDDRADALRMARRLRRAGLRARAYPLGVTF
ncbi:MAG TPA: 4-(cytidine 5'-diphospho)-2-C-methyl-D-erythritol kinase [Candidatus Limnocylindria bacterium]